MPHQNYEQVVAINSELLLRRYRFWKRLEPRTREDNFTRSVQARIRDPLWLLTRQWQLGEFNAEDAGSPYKTCLQTERTRLSHYRRGSFVSPGAVHPLPENTPLETLVEQEKLSIDRENLGSDHRMNIQIGLQLQRELQRQAVSEAAVQAIKRKYALTPPDEESRVKIDDETLALLDAVAKPADYGDGAQIPISGSALLEEDGLVSENPQLPADLSASLGDESERVIKALQALHSWWTTVYLQPESTDEMSWDHSSLGYSFCVSAPRDADNQYLLEVTESSGGELDWYDFVVHRDPGDKLEYVDEAGPGLQHDEEREFIPAPVSPEGMPSSRWWAFEDAKIDFGRMDVKTTDLGKLLLMEFAFIYGDDWFQVPIPLRIGSLCRVKSLKVYDVFGNVIDIEKAGSGGDQGWQRWQMFGVSYNREKQIGRAERRFDSGDFLFLPPTLGRSEVSPVIDEVRFIRDEAANKVWAIEHTVASFFGTPMSGFEYWRHRNRKVEERHLIDSMDRLLSIYNAVAKTTLEKTIERARSMKDIEELENDIAQIAELFSALEELGLMTANETGNDYITTLYEKHLEVMAKEDELQERTDREEDARVRDALNRCLRILSPCCQSLSEVLTSFRRILHTSTYEARESCHQAIKEGLHLLVDPSLLDDDQKRLLGFLEIAAVKGIPTYTMMSAVPENWIPYLPVHTDSGRRSIHLEQANMIRSWEDREPVRIQAQSRVLRSAELNGGNHRIDEEAVARHGVTVQAHFQRARWIDGSTHVWIGRRSGPGRGEGSSGLKFDYLIHTA